MTEALSRFSSSVTPEDALETLVKEAGPPGKTKTAILVIEGERVPALDPRRNACRIVAGSVRDEVVQLAVWKLEELKAGLSVDLPHAWPPSWLTKSSLCGLVVGLGWGVPLIGRGHETYVVVGEADGRDRELRTLAAACARRLEQMGYGRPLLAAEGRGSAAIVPPRSAPAEDQRPWSSATLAYAVRETGRIVRIVATSSMTIGRDPSCGLVLADEQASRKHARVFLVEGTFFVEDLHSRNGTWLDERPVLAPVRLPSDSVIRVGSTDIHVRLKP